MRRSITPNASPMLPWMLTSLYWPVFSCTMPSLRVSAITVPRLSISPTSFLKSPCRRTTPCPTRVDTNSASLTPNSSAALRMRSLLLSRSSACQRSASSVKTVGFITAVFISVASIDLGEADFRAAGSTQAVIVGNLQGVFRCACRAAVGIDKVGTEIR